MYAQETVEQKRIPSVSVYPNPDAVLKLTQIQNRNNLTKATSDAIKKENKESNPKCIQSGNSLISDIFGISMGRIAGKDKYYYED